MIAALLRRFPKVIPLGLYYLYYPPVVPFYDVPHLTTFDNKLGRADWKGSLLGSLGSVVSLVINVGSAILTLSKFPNLSNFPTDCAHLTTNN